MQCNALLKDYIISIYSTKVQITYNQCQSQHYFRDWHQQQLFKVPLYISYYTKPITSHRPSSDIANFYLHQHLTDNKKCTKILLQKQPKLEEINK